MRDGDGGFDQAMWDELVRRDVPLERVLEIEKLYVEDAAKTFATNAFPYVRQIAKNQRGDVGVRDGTRYVAVLPGHHVAFRVEADELVGEGPEDRREHLTIHEVSDDPKACCRFVFRSRQDLREDGLVADVEVADLRTLADVAKTVGEAYPALAAKQVWEGGERSVLFVLALIQSAAVPRILQGLAPVMEDVAARIGDGPLVLSDDVFASGGVSGGRSEVVVHELRGQGEEIKISADRDDGAPPRIRVATPKGAAVYDMAIRKFVEFDPCIGIDTFATLADRLRAMQALLDVAPVVSRAPSTGSRGDDGSGPRAG